MNFVFVRFLVPISQMKCRKKVFSKPLFFFSEKEDVTVNDVRNIGYVGRSNNTIAVY